MFPKYQIYPQRMNMYNSQDQEKDWVELWSQFQKRALKIVLANGHIFNISFYPFRVNRGIEAIWMNTFLCDYYKIRLITFIHLESCVIVANTNQAGKLIPPLVLIQMCNPKSSDHNLDFD